MIRQILIKYREVPTFFFFYLYEVFTSTKFRASFNKVGHINNIQNKFENILK